MMMTPLDRYIEKVATSRACLLAGWRRFRTIFPGFDLSIADLLTKLPIIINGQLGSVLHTYRIRQKGGRHLASNE